MDKPVPYTPEEQAFILAAKKRNMPTAVIAATFQRKFQKIVTPAHLQVFLDGGVKVVPVVNQKRQNEVEKIKDQLPDQVSQLQHLRIKMLERLESTNDEGKPVSSFDMVNLAAEIRKNITAEQQLASMNDQAGQAQFVLVYGDTIVKQSEDAKTIDMEVIKNE
jgi:hypothetical protein